MDAGAQAVIAVRDPAAGPAEQGKRPGEPPGQQRRDQRRAGQHRTFQQQKPLQTAAARVKDFGQVKGGVQPHPAEQVAAIDPPDPAGRPGDDALVRAGHGIGQAAGFRRIQAIHGRKA